jgi:hypothetical protein
MSENEWYETIKRVKPGIRLLGIVSMDEHKPKRYYARVFVLDDWYFKRNAFMFSKDKILKYTKELQRVKSWSDFANTEYFDIFAFNYHYANNPELGSPTMRDAQTKLRITMKEIADEYR